MQSEDKRDEILAEPDETPVATIVFAAEAMVQKRSGWTGKTRFQVRCM